MQAELVETLTAIRDGWALLERASGNPNHDELGKFASGPGGKGHGKHHAKRQRRKERLRKKWHAEAKAMKREHRGHWSQLKHDQKREHRRIRRQQKHDRVSFGKEYHAEQAKLRQEHLDEKKAGYKQAGEALRDSYKIRFGDLKEAQHKERVEQRKEFKDQKEGVREDHRRDKALLLKEARADIHKRVGRSIDDGIQAVDRGSRERLARDLRQANRRPYGRFHLTQTHKASSAEAILKHCLRQLGYTSRWREGRLTGRQHLRLLEAIRQYGRAWMRHEAEVFFEHYGIQAAAGRDGVESIGRSQIGAFRADQSGNRGLARNGADPKSGTLGSSSESDPETRSVGSTSRGLSDRILSPLRRWFDRAKQFVRESIHAGVTALKGDVLDADEAAEADRLAEIQDNFLDGFEAEFKANPSGAVAEPPIWDLPTERPMSPAQFAVRAELYGNAAWQAAQKVQRKRIFKLPVNVLPDTQGKPVDLVAEPPGFQIQYPIAGPPPATAIKEPKSKRKRDIRKPTVIPSSKPKFERRVLGHPKTEHCHDCPPLAALGWQPFGTLPDIGDSECGGLCLCHFEYTDILPTPAGQKPPASPSSEGIDLVAEPPGFEIAYPVAGPPP